MFDPDHPASTLDPVGRMNKGHFERRRLFTLFDPFSTLGTSVRRLPSDAPLGLRRDGEVYRIVENAFTAEMNSPVDLVRAMRHILKSVV